jgi:integrase/recombinase XerD
MLPLALVPTGAWVGPRGPRDPWTREPADVTTRDVLAFVEAQRRPRQGGNVVRIDDGEQGLSARTVKRRLSSVSGLFAYLVARGDVDSNPVP